MKALRDRLAADRTLEEISTKRLPDEIDREARRRKDLQDVARLADELARSAAEIPDSLATNQSLTRSLRRRSHPWLQYQAAENLLS